MGGADVGSQSPSPFDETGGQESCIDEPGQVFPILRQVTWVSNTARAFSSLAESMRHVLGGAREHDLPWRRPTMYPLTGRKQLVADSEGAGQEEDDSGFRIGCVGKPKKGQRKGGGGRLGFSSRVPIASKFPRRHSYTTFLLSLHGRIWLVMMMPSTPTRPLRLKSSRAARAPITDKGRVRLTLSLATHASAEPPGQGGFLPSLSSGCGTFLVELWSMSSPGAGNRWGR